MANSGVSRILEGSDELDMARFSASSIKPRLLPLTSRKEAKYNHINTCQLRVEEMTTFLMLIQMRAVDILRDYLKYKDVARDLAWHRSTIEKAVP